jgi:hypothetical protein
MLFPHYAFFASTDVANGGIALESQGTVPHAPAAGQPALATLPQSSYQPLGHDGHGAGRRTGKLPNSHGGGEVAKWDSSKFGVSKGKQGAAGRA